MIFKKLLTSPKELDRKTEFYSKEDGSRIAIAIYELTEKSTAIVYEKKWFRFNIGYDYKDVEFPRKVDQKLEELTSEFN